MNKLSIMSILAVIFLVGAGCSNVAKKSSEEEVMMSAVMDGPETEMMMEKSMDERDEMMAEVDDSMMMEMDKRTYEHVGLLVDVSDGNATGRAEATFEGGKYSLKASFENLVEPTGTDFYEGWVVRRGEEMSVISTGVVEKVDGVYTNFYSSTVDLTDHNYYVVTLEPDDGDPAPATHIAAGTLTRVE